MVRAQVEGPGISRDRSSPGPFVIFGRGHCGGRILSEVYHRAGIYLGELSRKNRDTHGMGLKSPWMVEVIRAAWDYPGAPPAEQARLEAPVAERVAWLQRRARGAPFGWKVGSSIFCIEILLRGHPDARVVHLIRDGRDVCLSRLDARLQPKRIRLPENRIAVFGRDPGDTFKGVPLEQAVNDESLRTELEMIHWKTATEFGLRGRAFPGQYLEVRYEDLCRDPGSTVDRVFDFIGVQLDPAARAWAVDNVHASRIGKWRGREDELREAFLAGEPLLGRLGYA